MSGSEIKLNKQAGKTEYSGRRRSATRKSGYKSHEEATGGKYHEANTLLYKLRKGESLTLRFHFKTSAGSEYYGFGAYYRVEGAHSISTSATGKANTPHTEYAFPSWSKLGSLWLATEMPADITYTITADKDCNVGLYDPNCGVVWHRYFDESRQSVLRNINIFSPEGLFYTSNGEVEIIAPRKASESPASISLKECNRCARFLPVNFHNERNTLSFSNHCIAKSPCKHKGFGLLVNDKTGAALQLTYGFQLECRICKKFAVNAALNPMRSANQMKEDGQRRRHFELLLSDLNGMSPQMNFRHATGKELATEIWSKFGKKCFKCKCDIPSETEMNLDHTRPLALLWQLDSTATCLCKACNSQKRDRYPVDFYTADELNHLSEITGISLNELMTPTPNLAALTAVMDNLDWIYEVFLQKENLQKVRDGKLTAELVCKALDRVLNLSSFKGKFSFVAELHRRDG